MNYILRRKGMGDQSMPIAAGIADVKIFVNKQDVLPPTAEYVFRWGTIGMIPEGAKVVNQAKAIEKVSDKRAFRLLLAQHGLSMPTYGKLEDYLLTDPQIAQESVLIRPATHSRSEDMFFCTALSEVVKAIKEINGQYYISNFIKKKNEYRVFVAQNRLVWMIKKHPKSEDDLTWGCVEEGNFEYIGWSDWPKELARVALESMKLSGLDFGAIDIIEDKDGKFYTLEINTAPWLSPYYAKCFGKVVKHVIANGKEHFPDAESYDWKKIIHPAIGG